MGGEAGHREGVGGDRPTPPTGYIISYRKCNTIITAYYIEFSSVSVWNKVRSATTYSGRLVWEGG